MTDAGTYHESSSRLSTQGHPKLHSKRVNMKTTLKTSELEIYTRNERVMRHLFWPVESSWNSCFVVGIRTDVPYTSDCINPPKKLVLKYDCKFHLAMQYLYTTVSFT
jgi:hypothetical protein